ncbi:hypothetical protein DCCM_2506 [Desulfocucumis palustris]|uniref:DUF4179 domain-containing protein n=1 Tax=Desulfocucumis palustris TaxID=1898651 RepID=A0A2L2XB28_9FIRM|nr:hypothetical protein [Desulfocucumis palustris]GBF33405.1 hypothetical protein DCCM_2506 [Desulfocucumis palustris]
MNEEKMIAMLGNLDDDLIEKEIDKLMDGVEFNMESINRKAHKKLAQHNRRTKFRKHLPYVAAVCACFIFINTVYAGEISDVIKSFFNKTPVYSTMVDGNAYYLKNSLKLDDNISIDSFMVSDGRLDMEITSKLGIDVLKDMKIVPEEDPDALYIMGGYSEDGNNKYSFSLMNGKENNYSIKPFGAFDMTIHGKVYPVTLDKAKSLDGTQKLYAGSSPHKTDKVNVGANSIENNGKIGVQLIASFKDKDMKLSAFGKPADQIFKLTFENTDNGMLSSSTRSRTDDIYLSDTAGNKYRLEIPADAKVAPVTTFETNAPKGSEFTLKLPALTASYHKTMDSFTLNIPTAGEVNINRQIDLSAQSVVVKSIKRVSPTAAVVEFNLNTGADKNVSVKSFMVFSKNVKKILSEFNGDKAVMTMEFNKDVDTADIEISWPEFVINGDWTINMK